MSLPKGQHDPVSLLGVLPALERSQLMNFESEMLLSEEERAAVLEKGLEGDMYLDPVLSNNTQAYHGFIADLFSCNILGFTLRPKMQVGAFFVSKKNGKQRLVIDARRANRLFRTPPSTCLGSVDCYGRLEVEPGSTVFMAQEDVKDYFYRLGIEPSLGDYFALPKINVLKLREELGSLPPEVIRLVDQHDGDIYPCLKVLPMGFNWAFHLAHQAHCHLASMAVPKAPILLDRRAAPRLGTLKGSVASSMLIYADNNNHIGVESSVVNRDQQVMLEELHKHGLDTHEEMDANTLIESLGVPVNGLVGQVTTTPTRDWRLDRALEGLAFHRPFISGRELEVIVGHITIRALLNRSLMSILRHAYVFIRQTYDRRQRLWKSVAKEMQIFRGVMVLGVANIFSQWDNQVLCTDACLSGYAVLESCHSSQVAADLGRNDERWRFRREDGQKVAPRAEALDTSKVFEDVRTVKPDIEGEVFGDFQLVPTFPNVNPDLMDKSFWHRLWKPPMWHKEPVHMIEARSILGAVKHRSRDHYRHHKRIVVLNDNMGVVLACQKGRCSNYGLLRILRRISAHALASGQRFFVRWVPSELNVADEDSRAWEGRRKAAESKERGAGLFKESSGGVQCKNEEPRQRSREEQKDREIQISPEGETERLVTPTWFERDGQVSRGEETQSEREAEKVPQEAEGCQWGENNPRDSQCIQWSEKGLCESAERLLPVRKLPSASIEKRGRVRHSSIRLHGRVVPEWGRSGCRQQAQSGLGIRPARGSEGWLVEPAEDQERFERVEEVGTWPNQDAHVGVPEEWHQWGPYPFGIPRYGTFQRDQFLHLCPPWGAPEIDARGCRSSQQQFCPRCVDPWSHRKRTGVESRHLRRDSHSGRHSCSIPRTSDGATRKEKDQGGQVVGLHSSQLSEEMEAGSGNHADSGCGPFSLSESSRRCQQRFDDETSKPPSNSEKREMGQRRLRKNLRKARKVAAAGEPIQQEAGSFRRGCEEELSGLLPEKFHPAAAKPAAKDQL